MKKRKLVFAGLFLLSLLLNAVLLLWFREKISFTAYSLFPTVLLCLLLLNGAMAFIFRHKANFFEFIGNKGKKWRIFEPDREETFTEEYARNFTVTAFIYFTGIPFFLPCIFFSSHAGHTLWSLLVALTPQMIFFAHDIYGMTKEIAVYRDKKKKEAEELDAQKKREEMGFFK